MRIGQKIGAVIGGLLVVQAATVATMSALLFDAERSSRELLQANNTQVDYATSLRDTFNHEENAWDRLVINSSDPTLVVRYRHELFDAVKQVNTTLGELETAATDPHMTEAIEEFERQHRAITPLKLAAMPDVVAGNPDAAALQRISALQDEALVAAARPLELIEAKTEQSLAEHERSQRRLLWTTVLAAFGLLAGLVVFAVVMTRRVVRPIRNMITQATDAAGHTLPEAADQVRHMEGDVTAPSLQRFEAQTKDELADLAGALNKLQDSAINTAVGMRKAELVHAETLVNLGRRNQSMLSRNLNYLAELERSEPDPDKLSQLFRLDHLTTRIRRNAESMLVLAGARQSRTHSRPVSIGNVLRAALAEIEDYPRVQVTDLEPATLLGSIAADVAHLLAELLENATAFSPNTSTVTVAGAGHGDSYRLVITDSGMGMSPAELEEANRRLHEGDEVTHDTKVLGHHIVARLATRLDIQVELSAGSPRGTIALVTLPHSLLLAAPTPAQSRPSTAGAPKEGGAAAAPSLPGRHTDFEGPAEPQSPAEPEGPAAQPESADSANSTASPAGAPETTPADAPAPEPAERPGRTQPAAACTIQEAPELRGWVTETASAHSPAVDSPLTSTDRAEMPAPVAKATQPVGTEPVARHESREPITTNRTSPAPPASTEAGEAAERGFQPRPDSSQSQLPTRRVRGANLGDLAEDSSGNTASPQDPTAIRSALSGLQTGVQNARRQLSVHTSRPVSLSTDVASAQQPARPEGNPEDDQPSPQRRVRGAQMPDLGEGPPPDGQPHRDAAQTRTQMSDLQKSVARARQETEQAFTDETEQN